MRGEQVLLLRLKAGVASSVLVASNFRLNLRGRCHTYRDCCVLVRAQSCWQMWVTPRKVYVLGFPSRVGRVPGSKRPLAGSGHAGIEGDSFVSHVSGAAWCTLRTKPCWRVCVAAEKDLSIGPSVCL
jgi:hypothetical protein